MIDEGIHDGDMVLVERREVADDGELVVAILEKEGIEGATLKKFFHHSGEDGKKQFRLQPANEELEPIIVDELEIRGVVVGVVRRYPRWAE
jgi:repressor LexA